MKSELIIRIYLKVKEIMRDTLIVMSLLCVWKVHLLSANPPEIPYEPSRTADQNSELLTHSA